METILTYPSVCCQSHEFSKIDDKNVIKQKVILNKKAPVAGTSLCLENIPHSMSEFESKQSRNKKEIFYENLILFSHRRHETQTEHTNNNNNNNS